MKFLCALNNARLNVGRFLGLIGACILGLTFLVFAVFIIAVIIDMMVYLKTGNSLGLTKPFMSGSYSRSDTGLEGIAAAILIGLASGAAIFGLGKLIAVGDPKRW